MQKLIFVIGVTATGKTHFIKEHYAGQDVETLDVYDYQQRAYDEAGVGASIWTGQQMKCLRQANAQLLEDVLAKLEQGQDVVVEHTLYKAKRRIAYIDEIRKKFGDAVAIVFYVMQPTEERWEANILKRKLPGGVARYKRIAEELEFPNVAEGIDEIYEVVDGEIRARRNPPAPDIVEPARKELRQEEERVRKKEAEAQRKEELLESMKTRKFWHYCEVCGRKEYITAEEAFDDGWDYPPNIGFFGLLGPRTCGDCRMADTLYWKIQTGGGLPIVLEGELSPEELITWRRIKGEPESLLEEEDGND